MKESDYTEEQLQRPNANYVILIHEAIKDSKLGEMNLQQIYHAIEKRYPFYRFKVSTTGWQSSVRHNLQQNEAFVKIRREGKGYVWGVNPNVTVEKEKRKRVSPPPQHRPFYNGYSAARSYGLQQNSNLPQQGPYASHSQSSYPSPQLLLPPHLPGTSRNSTYSSPYAPLRRPQPQPQPSNMQQSSQTNLAQTQFHSPYHGQAGHSSLPAQKIASHATPHNFASSILNAQQTIRQSGVEIGATAASTAATLSSAVLPPTRLSTGDANLQTSPPNSSSQNAAILKHIPPSNLMTVMADFRQRFLGANEQSARSESIIDPIIRRFTHPKEPHEPPKPHENIIIKIIEGMLREMQSNKIEEESGKASVSNGKTAITEAERPHEEKLLSTSDVAKGEEHDEKGPPLPGKDKSDARSASAQSEKDATQGVTSAVANGLLDSLASAAAVSSATIVKSTPSNVTPSVVNAVGEANVHDASVMLSNTANDASSSSLSSDEPQWEAPATEQSEAQAESLKAEDQLKANIIKGSKRSIDEVIGQADQASSDAGEKAVEPKKLRP